MRKFVSHTVLLTILSLPSLTLAYEIVDFQTQGASSTTNGSTTSTNDTLYASAFIPKFNILGATLIYYNVFATANLDTSIELDRLDQGSEGYLSVAVSIDSVSYLGTNDPGLIGVTGGLANCYDYDSQPCLDNRFADAAWDVFLELNPLDVIGVGTTEVQAIASLSEVTSLNVANLSFSSLLSLVDARAEYAYCIDGSDKDGFESCADIFPNYPVVGPDNGNGRVPEPGTVALFAIGLLGLAFRGRSRQILAGRVK